MKQFKKIIISIVIALFCFTLFDSFYNQNFSWFMGSVNVFAADDKKKNLPKQSPKKKEKRVMKLPVLNAQSVLILQKLY